MTKQPAAPLPNDTTDGGRTEATPEAPARRSRLRRWVFRLVAVVGGPLLVLGLLEAGLRLGGYGYDTGYFFSPEEETLAGNPRFGWRFFPPSIARLPPVFALTDPAPPETFRVFVFGASAALGTPDESYSFARFLEVMLRERFPGRRIEVINTAIVAINSHVVREIAADCAGQSPNAFVVYLGNNEVVGPYGAGTVFAGHSPYLGLIRASLGLRATRVGQLAHGLVSGPGEDAPQTWKGMGFFLGEQVAADDPRLASVYGHFEANLRAICATGRDAGAEVLLCTVGVNLADSAPFASLHDPSLTAAEIERFDALLAAGAQHVQAGAPDEAAAAVQAAVEIDPRHADAHYRLGRALLALGDVAAAQSALARARDLDALRFRADSAINATIRRVGGDAGVRLVDVERLFAEAGAPDSGLFYEHCHMRPRGNHLIAAALYPLVVERLAGVGTDARTNDADADAPGFERCAALLGLSDWDRGRLAMEMVSMLQHPPFTNQSDHAEQLAAMEAAVDGLRAAAVAEDAFATARAMYEAAIEAAPDDWRLRRNFAALLLDMGKPWEAARQLRSALKEVPFDARLRRDLGTALYRQGRVEEAVTAYRRALRSPYADRSFRAELFFNMAVVCEQLKRDAIAQEYYERVLELRPDDIRALTNLGLLHKRGGRFEQALALIDRALAIEPEMARTRLNRAIVLMNLRRHAEAASILRALRAEHAEAAGLLLTISKAFVAMGDRTEALAAARAAVAAEPASADAHYTVAALLLAEGQIDAGRDALERALELAPGHAQSRALAERLRGQSGVNPGDGGPQ